MDFSVILKFPEDDSKQLEILRELQETETEISIYYTNLDLSRTQKQITTNYALLINRNFDDGSKSMTTENLLSVEFVRQFIYMFKNPTIWPFDKEVVDKIYTGNTTALIYFTKERKEENFQSFTNFAFENRHRLRLYTCDFSDFLCENLAYSVGADVDSKEWVFILDNQGSGLKRYKFKSRFTSSNLSKFVDDFQSDLLSPFVKSEPEPVENEGIILKVVRNTFIRHVHKSKKNVVFLGYSESDEWAAQEPIFERLAQKFTSDEVLFVKMDASKNEHEKLYLTKVPEVLIYRKGLKDKPLIFLDKFDEEKLDEFFSEAFLTKTKTNNEDL